MIVNLRLARQMKIHYSGLLKDLIHFETIGYFFMVIGDLNQDRSGIGKIVEQIRFCKT